MNLDRHEIMTRFQQYSNQGGRWYEINNADGSGDEPAEIRIYGVIGSGFWGDVGAQDFIEQLDEVTASEIIVSINSPGGDVFDGVAIYNGLRQHHAHITTKVDGIALSAASFIAQAGDHRIMVESSQMMIHNAWGFMIGDANEMREMGDLLDQQDDIIAGIYASRSGKDRAGFRDLMSAETWFTDQATVDAGLADEVLVPARKDKNGGTDGDGDPADTNARNKYSEHLDAVLAAVGELTDRTEEVIAFRTDQGKPPLAEGSVESLNELVARLEEVIATEEAPPAETGTTGDIEDEFLKFVATTQGV